MHRATPLNSSFRSFVSGGAGSMVHEVDDTKLLQEMKGNFMKGESRSKVEAPQNYGFSSVTADADKQEAQQGSGGQGAAGGEGPSSGMGAEAFITFAGGNRSFPTATVIDDRRHRLKGLEKGDVAMFGQRDWGQQFHLNKSGMYMSGNVDKRVKVQLVKNEQEDERGGGQQGGGQQGGAQAQTTAAGGGGGGNGHSGGQQKGQKQAKGQKQLYDKESDKYYDIDSSRYLTKHGDGHVHCSGDKIMTYHSDETKSTRVDTEHVHIRFVGNRIWIDKGGCWSTMPIQIKQDPDGGNGGGSARIIGTTAVVGSPPLSIGQDGNISMAVAQPLFVDESGKLAIDLADMRAEIATLRREIEELRKFDVRALLFWAFRRGR